MIGMVSIVTFNLGEMRDHLLEERRTKAKHIVEIVHQSLMHYHNLTDRGILSQEGAQQLAIRELRNLRYDRNEYFWLNDMSPKIIMHPHRSDLEGKDVADFVDPNGVPVFDRFVQKVRLSGAGFVEYLWPKPGDDEPQKKISFVKGFKPWGWIVGSGVYLDDVNAVFWRQAAIMTVVSIIIFVLVILTSLAIGRGISRPIASITRHMARLADGDLTVSTPVKHGETEIGDLERAMAAFKVRLQEKEEATVSLKKLSTAVEQSPATVVITDRFGYIEYVNPKFEDITGYSAKEVIGAKPSILKSGDTNEEAYRDLWETISSGQTWHGEFKNRRKNGEFFWELASISPITNEEGEITHYLSVKEDINARKEYERKLFDQANFDNLTGCPNRALANDRLSQAIKRAHRNKTVVVVMFLDLDNFKKVNDTLGHSTGDELLKSTAERLKGCVREGDTVARLGGDEFLVVIPDLKTPFAAEGIATKIIETLGKTTMINGNELVVSASIGMTAFPDDGDNVSDLLKNADAAMYKAKEAGRNGYRFYTPEMNNEALRRLEIESHLRHAIERNELSLHFQPIVEIPSGNVYKAEALLRWTSPELGLIRPDEFIPIAEDAGLIVEMGEWVLQHACENAVRWNRGRQDPVRVAVNVAFPQVRHGDFDKTVAMILDKTGLDAHLLDIEITERVFMSELVTVDKVLSSLRRLGVNLSIDDFGTGYSSITYLKRFPINALKIDKSFIQGALCNAEDAALVTGIIAMAKSLGMSVTGEGVESAQQLEYLVSANCDLAQGYFMSTPLSEEEFHRFLKDLGHDTLLQGDEDQIPA